MSSACGLWPVACGLWLLAARVPTLTRRRKLTGLEPAGAKRRGPAASIGYEDLKELGSPSIAAGRAGLGPDY